MGQNDPLEGFRARTQKDDDNEEIVRSIRGLNERGIDYQSISGLIASNELKAALSEDTTLAKLATYCHEVMVENSTRWATADDPRDVDKLHLETRAAGMVIAWMDSIIQTGEVAEQLIEQEDIQEND